MRGRSGLAALAAPALFLILAGAANAATITFDDLRGASGQIRNGYAGLNWSNFYFVNPHTLDNPEGYATGMVSSPNVAFNGSGAPAWFSAVSGTFTLGSLYLTALRHDGLNVMIEGDNGSTLVDSQVVTVGTTGPTFVTLNWSGLTEVKFSSSQGGASGNGYQFVLDDLTVNAAGLLGAPAPNPTPGAGLVCLGFLALGGFAARARGVLTR
jgi:hypothetical protein